ncbi:MAG: prolyl oligopeptidase family serine peptidase [Gemmatimonadota bacterium]
MKTIYDLTSPGKLVALLMSFWAAHGCAQTSRELAYPPTARGQDVDEFHGVSVPDPYRWLEDLDSRETQEWLAAQDSLTSRFLRAIPERSGIERQLRSYGSVTSYRRAMKEGGRYFYTRTEPGRVSVLFVQESLEGEPRVLIDPQEQFPEGNTSVGLATPSRDGRLLAYSLNSGLMWQEVRLLDVDSGGHLPETLSGVTWSSSIAWTPDGSGFFYMRFDEPPPGTEMTAKPTNSRVMYHELNTDQSQDKLIYRRPSQPTVTLGPIQVTYDGRFLVFGASGESVAGTSLLYKDLNEPESPVQTLIQHDDNAHRFVGAEGETFWIQTTLDAPNGRFVAVDLDRSEPDRWRTLIPESASAPLVQVVEVGDHFIAWHTVDVKPRLQVYLRDGSQVGEVELPSVTGYIGGGMQAIRGRRDDPELFFDFSSAAYPSSLFIHDTETGVDKAFSDESLPWNPEDIAIEQVFFESRDGTRVPMFLVYREGTIFDGQSVTYMPGYGAGGWMMNAGFSPLSLVLAESGGLVAIPGLRGGGEYGVTWHEAGAGRYKQNTFDDFIAAAEWLIEEGYTSPRRLIVQGLSAGGVIPAAATTQRPDLFGMSLPTWPVIEMIRFTEYTGGSLWVSEYGSPEVPEDFEALHAYSPYHNVREGTCYPATLVVAGENDQTAMPMHAYKFVAALQHAQSCDNPILLDVVWGGGHMPTSAERPAHFADYLAFAAQTLGADFSIDQ